MSLLKRGGERETKPLRIFISDKDTTDKRKKKLMQNYDKAIMVELRFITLS